ncbi:MULTISPECIES: hypothetical protein [Brachybacterium]|nr:MULTISPECIES: hypothetical protein [Brachybacterium]
MTATTPSSTRDRLDAAILELAEDSEFTSRELASWCWSPATMEA